jgi:hypothetical protein
MKTVCIACEKTFHTEKEVHICNSCYKKNSLQLHSYCDITEYENDFLVEVQENKINANFFDVRITPTIWERRKNDKKYFYEHDSLDLDDTSEFLEELKNRYKIETVIADFDLQSREWLKKLYNGYKGFTVEQADYIRTDKISKTETRDVWVSTISICSTELRIEKEFSAEGSLDDVSDGLLELEALELTWNWFQKASEVLSN